MLTVKDTVDGPKHLFIDWAYDAWPRIILAVATNILGPRWLHMENHHHESTAWELPRKFKLRWKSWRRWNLGFEVTQELKTGLSRHSMATTSSYLDGGWAPHLRPHVWIKPIASGKLRCTHPMCCFQATQHIRPSRQKPHATCSNQDIFGAPYFYVDRCFLMFTFKLAHPLVHLNIKNSWNACAAFKVVLNNSCTELYPAKWQAGCAPW